MLVLKRKAGESLLIGDEVEVRILAVEGEHVRVGIVAPQSITVLRGELVDEVRNETQASAAPQLSAIQGLSRQLKARGTGIVPKPLPPKK